MLLCTYVYSCTNEIYTVTRTKNFVQIWNIHVHSCDLQSGILTWLNNLSSVYNDMKFAIVLCCHMLKDLNAFLSFCLKFEVYLVRHLGKLFEN